MGLLQPVGALMPLAEAQSELIGDVLTGAIKLPSSGQMSREMQTADRQYKKRFYDSPRHTMEVDFDRFLWDIKRTRKKLAKNR